MASIGVRNNKLVLDFRYKGVRCREQTALTDSRSNRAKLTKLIDDIEAAIRLGRFVYTDFFPGSPRAKHFECVDNAIKQRQPDATPAVLYRDCPTFSAFSAEWLGENEGVWKVSHNANVIAIFEHYLLPTFGMQRLDVISRADILKLRANLTKQKDGKKRISNDWINHIMAQLRKILAEAAIRYTFDNPFVDIKPLKIEKPLINPLTLQEVRMFLAGVRPDFRQYYTIRFFTGLRTAEVDGLKWKFIDFERRQIVVQETIVNGNKETPKNQHSYRHVHMSNAVFEALTAQKLITGHCEFVFCNAAGNPLDHRNVTKRIWTPTLKLLGLTHRRAYETRHTAATLWLAAGENPEWIARQLGHSSTKMLFERYSRFVPNVTRQDGSAFEALLIGF
ncbi:site-specific integrase [Rheinheimera aquimaris]|uniref:site-specific integrase n=1 Tax=Rheinheimera aquimaris TaxID=412437 RepID=UPI001E427607|nr:site-specific integrase [Rheinheimera aquimaris]MCD1598277.1 site-specific integrase [Rheinheimera aquimaris]